MVRTLGENDTDLPARSPSAEKGDIEDPTQHTPGRGSAGAPFDKYDLMSPL